MRALFTFFSFLLYSVSFCITEDGTREIFCGNTRVTRWHRTDVKYSADRGSPRETTEINPVSHNAYDVIICFIFLPQLKFVIYYTKQLAFSDHLSLSFSLSLSVSLSPFHCSTYRCGRFHGRPSAAGRSDFWFAAVSTISPVSSPI